MVEITIDIDSEDRANLLAIYSKAKKYGKTRVTKTAKGFHLRISSHIEDPWEILRIRRIIGDDPKRLAHDVALIQLGHPELANRLFQCKRPLGSKGFVKERPVEMEER